MKSFRKNSELFFLGEIALHEAHGVQWEAELMAATKLTSFEEGEKSPQRKGSRPLEQELRRNETALAEPVALMMLKKADSIWREVKGREISFAVRGMAWQSTAGFET
jgi:hypothetical protein